MKIKIFVASATILLVIVYFLVWQIKPTEYADSSEFIPTTALLYVEQKNVEVIAEIDDFSEYYPLVNAYYFDGELNFNQKERILLEIYGDKQIIRDFPFLKRYKSTEKRYSIRCKE